MQIVVVLSPAEGMGRTTVASMLTAALLAREDGPCVLALDAAATENAGDFLAWARRQRRKLEDWNHHRDTLTARRALDVGDLLRELDLAASGKSPSNGVPVDIAVIDTPARVDARTQVALRAADVVLVPVRSRAGEAQVATALKPILLKTLPAFRLDCGFGPSEPTDAGHPTDAKRKGRGSAPTGLAMTGMGFDIPYDPRFVEVVARGCQVDDMAQVPGWAVAEALAAHVVTELAYKPDYRFLDPSYRLMVPPVVAPS